jgi:hypothetical protein
VSDKTRIFFTELFSIVTCWANTPDLAYPTNRLIHVANMYETTSLISLDFVLSAEETGDDGFK